MKYILTIIFSLALVSPVFASETPWQTFITGEGSNAGSISTGIEGTVISAPTANPDPSEGPFTSTQTVTLVAPGSTSIHHFFNTTDFNSALTCSTGDTTNPVEVVGSGLLRAIACYGDIAGPLASFSYEFSSPPATTPAPSSGGSTGGSGGGGYTPPTTPPTTAQADFDDSGSVDILDFNVLITNWGTTTGAVKATGDTDGNGTVDIFDFNILIANWSL